MVKTIILACLIPSTWFSSLCHSFVTHLMENDIDIRTVQELMGHKVMATTTIYTHVLN